MDTCFCDALESACMDVATLGRELRAEAVRANERRVLVLAGEVERTRDRTQDVVDALDVGVSSTTVVGPAGFLPGEHVATRQADDLLGRTRDVVVLDCHAELRPNALGRVVGAVDGGGLLIVLAPDLDAWPARRDDFDAGMAVPPFGIEDVTGRFRTRLVELADAHRGVAVVDVDADADVDTDADVDAGGGGGVELRSDGRTHPPPVRERESLSLPDDGRFPDATYAACRTQDQVDAVGALEGVLEDDVAVVVEADRGRGKSSAAGLAAGALAAGGETVVVTAPKRRGCREVFERGRELLATLGCAGDHAGEYDLVAEPARDEDDVGRVRYEPVADVVDDPDVADACDVLVVDEAAAIPVRRLEGTLAFDRVAYATTVHGYEGTGRGFDVRFRGHLEESVHDVVETQLVEPIRYATGDPVEVWAFRTLLLDARPPVDDLVADATPDSVEYHTLDADDLFVDEHLLRETFGSLVLAHYRTEPDDLARLLDAPNLSVRALLADGHVACVALLAREGDLPAGLRADMYEGGRVKGNMLPDVLTSQLRDEAAADLVGYRVVRIATHHAVRRGGLASRLLECVREEVAPNVDWLGSGFGATPGLVDFWAKNGYGSVHLSTTRNDASGEYSTIVLDPTSDAGTDLAARHADWFASRAPSVLADALDDCDPDVVRATLRACDADVHVDLAAPAWRTVVGASYGPGLFDVAPAPFRDLVAKHLVDSEGSADALAPREERLLVMRVLQARPWSAVADELEYVSPGACMRALGDAVQPLVDAYGNDLAHAERDRFRD